MHKHHHLLLAGALALLPASGCRRDPCVLNAPPATAQFAPLSQDYDRAITAARANAAAWGKTMRGFYPTIVAGTCADGAIRFIALRRYGGGGGETYYYDAKTGRFLAYVTQADLYIPEDPCRGA